MAKTLGLSVLMLTLIGSTSSVHACWARVPMSKLVADNPVIVIGTIEKVVVGKVGPDGEAPHFDIGHIAVRKVLKNTLVKHPIKVGDKLLLSMPSVRSRNPKSTALHHKKGTEGIWLLEKKGEAFWATYPGDRQPLKQEAEVTRLLKKRAVASVGKGEAGKGKK